MAKIDGSTLLGLLHEADHLIRSLINDAYKAETHFLLADLSSNEYL